MLDLKLSSGRIRLGATLFRLTVGFALLLAARSLFFVLPTTPAVRGLYTDDVQEPPLRLRRQWENAARRLPAEGNVFVQFRLPADDLTAASAYFTWTYLLYPRTVYVAAEPRVINDSRDLAEPLAFPEAGWLRAHGVTTTLLVDRDAGGQLRIHSIEE